MSKPDIIPETTVSGIAVDPRTLERVIPESRRPDGTYVPTYDFPAFPCADALSDLFLPRSYALT